MDLDSLIQLIVLLGAGLAWLLGGGRKQPSEKNQTPPVLGRRSGAGVGGRPRRVPGAAGRLPAGERVGARVPVPQRTSPEARRKQGGVRERRQEALEDLYRILTGGEPGGPVVLEEPPPPQVEPPIEAEPLERIPEVEARSLETLEPAGEPSHERFHELYLGQPQPARRQVRRLRLKLTPANAREAMLWREVLGPPKGLL